MEQHLQFIQEFANTISNTFRQFAGLCRAELAKSKENKPDYADLVQQLIKERKLRMELQDKIKQRISGINNQQLPASTSNQDKRPKNAFALFLADQRVKINKEHPSINFYRISALAAIKWKKLTEQQKQVYERKFQQMNKLYDEQQYLMKQGKIPQPNNDASIVKKEFAQQEEARQAENQRRAQEQDEKDEANREFNEIFRNDSKQNRGQQVEQQANATLPIENNQQNQPTLAIEESNSQVRKETIEKILDLFHTPVSQQPQLKIDDPISQLSFLKAGRQSLESQKQSDNQQHSSFQQRVEHKQESNINQNVEPVEPSLMIIQPAAPIVIDPTVRQQSE